MKTLIYTAGISVALTFAACNSNSSEEQASIMADTIGSATLAADLPGTESKLVKTADVDFKVQDVYKSSIDISRTVQSLGGITMQQNIQTIILDTKEIPRSDDSVQAISSYNIDAHMTVKVPSENLNEFLETIKTKATLIYTSTFKVDDQSINYLGSKLKQQSRQQILDRQLRKDTLKNEDVLQLANQQEAVIDEKMNNLRTDADVRYSSIHLHFTQAPLVQRQILPNSDLKAYQPTVSRRLTEALSSGLEIFIAILVGILYLWPFLLLGSGGWLAYRFLSQRINTKAG